MRRTGKADGQGSLSCPVRTRDARWAVTALLAGLLAWTVSSRAFGDVAVNGALSWDGIEADCIDGPVPNHTAGNVAAKAAVRVIASGALPAHPSHQIEHTHDGLYGNDHSWIGEDEESWIGYDFGRELTCSALAFSRDNTGLGLTDRTLGNYRVQVATGPYAGPATPWRDIGTITYSGKESWALAKRHHFALTPSIRARCIRIRVPAGACIDEIECYEDPVSRSLPPARSLPPPARTTVALRRGIALDRQVHAIPAPDMMAVRAGDVRLIRSMGFDFIKLIVNPAVLQNGRQAANLAWVQQIVDTVVQGGLVAVVCLHPERPFKEALFGDPERFREYLGFQEAFGRFLAEHWTAEQVAFELMTEPFGTSQKPADWNHWNALQPRLWEAARRALPKHTLILSGDQVGHLRGAINVQPVDDANVMYSFTTYDPVCFTHQKAPWLEAWWPCLGGVPYPSSPEAVQVALPAILAAIPPEPPEWRQQARAVLEAYGQEGWSKARQERRIEQIVQWNRFYGGGLNLWCAEFGVLGSETGGAHPQDRTRFIRDLREVFEANQIGWSYWSYNEVFTVLRPEHRRPFGDSTPADIDDEMLKALGLGL